MRRASVSEWISATRRPSLVVSVHIGYTCGCSACACAVAAARVRESIVAFMTPTGDLYMFLGVFRRICRRDGNSWSQIPFKDAANNPGDVLPGPMKYSRVVYPRPYPRQCLSIRNLRRFLQQSQSSYRAAHHHTPEVSDRFPRGKPGLTRLARAVLSRRSSRVKAVPRLTLGAVSATGVCESALFMMLFLVAVHSRQD